MSPPLLPGIVVCLLRVNQHQVFACILFFCCVLSFPLPLPLFFPCLSLAQVLVSGHEQETEHGRS